MSILGYVSSVLNKKYLICSNYVLSELVPTAHTHTHCFTSLTAFNVVQQAYLLFRNEICSYSSQG